jgi:hypothetical protein
MGIRNQEAGTGDGRTLALPAPEEFSDGLGSLSGKQRRVLEKKLRIG